MSQGVPRVQSQPGAHGGPNNITTTENTKMKKTSTKLSDMVQKARDIRTTRGQGDHLVVEALAGTGKTTTLVVGLAWIFRKAHPGLWKKVKAKIGFDPEATATPQQMAVWEALAAPYGPKDLPRWITYVAFNRSIVAEFSQKFSWLVKDLKALGVGLSFSTCHSLGFAACRKGLGLKAWGSVNKWRTRDLLEEILGVDLREWSKEAANFSTMKAVEELVKHSKTSLVDPLDENLDSLASHYLIDPVDPARTFGLVRQILEASITDISEVDYSDQIWLPLVLGLDVFRSDLLLGDEAQDWNSCQQGLICRAAHRGTVCGDTFQAIYGFAGADVDSIPTMARLLGETRKVQVLPLTVTRRCAKAIVREAQKIVPEFEAHESNPEGEVLHVGSDEAWKMVGEKDMIVGRTNAPLVSWAFRLIKAGKKANIQGRDIGQGLIKLIDTIAGKKRKSVVDLVDGVHSWHDREAQKLAKKKRPNEEALIALKDRRDCLLAFCEDAPDISTAKKNISRTFQGLICPVCGKHYDEGVRECFSKDHKGTALVKPEGTLLSSIHRAKGLEAPRVFLIHPELLPHPMARTAWARGQEENLEYVAKTRAIESLVIVEEDE